MSVTFFVAHLTCPVCGTVSAADTSTRMSSHLLFEPGTHVLGVGDSLDADIGDMKASYLTLREPQPNEPIFILENWYCPTCKSSNWAYVIIHNGVIQEIKAMPLTKETFDKAHFISEHVSELFEERTGQALFQGTAPRQDFIESLRAILPD